MNEYDVTGINQWLCLPKAEFNTKNSTKRPRKRWFFLIATPLFFMPPKWGGIRICRGGIKGGGIKISDFQGVA